VSVSSSTNKDKDNSCSNAVNRAGRRPKFKAGPEISGTKSNVPLHPSMKNSSNRDTSTGSACSSKNGPSKSVPPAGLARAVQASDTATGGNAKALDLDLFNPTSTTAAAKTVGVKGQQKALGGSVVSRAGSSNSLVKATVAGPIAKQLDTSRILDRTKAAGVGKPTVAAQKETNALGALPGSVDKPNLLTKSASNLDKIDGKLTNGNFSLCLMSIKTKLYYSVHSSAILNSRVM